MDLVITILPVVTKDLPISPRFTPYNFFIAMQVQHSYNSSTNGFFFCTTYSAIQTIIALMVRYLALARASET